VGSERGWPTFETFAARLAAGHRARARNDRHRPAGRVWSIGEGRDAGGEVAALTAPEPLETMLARLDSTVFTGAADCDKVKEMLRAYNALLAELAHHHRNLVWLERTSPATHRAYLRLLRALARIRDALQSRRRLQRAVSAADAVADRVKGEAHAAVDMAAQDVARLSGRASHRVAPSPDETPEEPVTMCSKLQPTAGLEVTDADQ
jgi:hypothetical protein